MKFAVGLMVIVFVPSPVICDGDELTSYCSNTDPPELCMVMFPVVRLTFSSKIRAILSIVATLVASSAGVLDERIGAVVSPPPPGHVLRSVLIEFTQISETESIGDHETLGAVSEKAK